MAKQSKIAEIMRNIFSPNAIKAAAIGEQLEDPQYCTENGMNHLNGGKELEKWEKQLSAGEKLLDNDTTYTVDNLKKFRQRVDEFLKHNPGARLYDGLSGDDRFAVRRFYYYNTH